MHSTSNLDDDYIGSGKRLWNSIRKYGRENFSKEILEWLPDRISLKAREKELVNESLIQDPMCMNLAIGGHGGFINKEAASAGAIGMNKKNWANEDFIKRKSETTSLRNKALHIEGRLKAPNWSGKHHSIENRKRIGERNSKSQKGNKNSQFGKMWITNIETKENRKIENTATIPEKWKKGRSLI
jgi:hypothetical protein